MKLNQRAKELLEDRYLPKKTDGTLLETPRKMIERVAYTVSNAELQYGIDPAPWKKKFMDIMMENKFLPNLPTLINAGRPLGQLMACFILEPADSIDSILDTATDMAIIFKSGGGVGVGLDKLRGKGVTIKTTGGSASGPVSFLEIYSTITSVIEQGSYRRGALSATLSANHPDISVYLHCKSSSNRLNNVTLNVAFDTFDPKDKILQYCLENMYNNGEPNILFLDNINDRCGLPYKVNIVNACSEVPGERYDSCNLGSINLMEFIKDDGFFDYDGFATAIEIAVRFLDDVIDINRYPLPRIEKKAKEIRRIGLGVMGYGDLMRKIDINPRELLGVLKGTAYESSRILGKEKGVTNYDRRNTTLLSFAPTGTLSLLAGVSPGIQFPDYEIRPLSEQLETLILFQEYSDSGVSYTVLLDHELEYDCFFSHIMEYGPKLSSLSVYRDGTREDQPYQCKTGSCGI